MASHFTYSRAGDPGDVAALRDLLCQAFHISVERWDTFLSRADGNLRLVRDENRVVGGLAIYAMGQWFGGRSMPVAGIAAVGVAPEHRARGAAAELMAGTLRELHEEGVPLSALYASTQRLYRKVGYAQAGTSVLYEMPLSSIGIADHSVPLTRVDPSDHALFHRLSRERASRSNGNLERSEGMWQRLVSPQNKTACAFMIGKAEVSEGFILYLQEQKDGQEDLLELHVRDMVAASPAAARSIWTFFADHRSLCSSVSWCGPANDPLLRVPAEQAFRVKDSHRWLLRVVHVREALSRRGYPQGVEAELHLQIRDETLPANQGRIVLAVADGKGEVRSGGRGDLKADVRGLAPLFSGMFSATELRITGHLEGEVDALRVAELLFGGPEPWMPDRF
ncbi:MAG: enhanced intracellular survival protein Eis [Planctomycetota bacterium]